MDIFNGLARNLNVHILLEIGLNSVKVFYIFMNQKSDVNQKRYARRALHGPFYPDRRPSLYGYIYFVFHDLFIGI